MCLFALYIRNFGTIETHKRQKAGCFYIISPITLMGLWVKNVNSSSFFLSIVIRTTVAGPATVIVVTISKNALNGLSGLISKPIHVIGSFCR